MKTKKSIFVTVGTTRFDSLVTVVTHPQSIQWMIDRGYTHLTIQYGRGMEPITIIPKTDCDPLLQVRSYSFRPSLEAELRNADLIISHAGAGTILEALRFMSVGPNENDDDNNDNDNNNRHGRKRLVVVINTSLMDNHQMELAHAMAARQHLFVVDNPSQLYNVSTWNNLQTFIPRRYPRTYPEDNTDFVQLLNQHMGVI